MNDILYGQKEETYYQLLGCVPSSTIDQITTEYRKRALKYHPDKNKNYEELFKKVSKAYKVLSNNETRKQYDKWLNCGIRIPFEKWNSLSKETQASVHWRPKENEPLRIEQTNPEPVLQHGQEDSNLLRDFRQESSVNNSLASKFRNYEI